MDKNIERARNNGGNGESPEQKKANEALKNYSPVKPGFDGTQTKIVSQRIATGLTTASMDELKQADASLQGKTVEELEIAADLNDNAQIDDPNLQDAEVPVTDETEDEGEPVDPKALAEMSIAEISEHIGSLNKRQLNALERAEANGKQRTGVADLIERRRNELG